MKNLMVLLIGISLSLTLTAQEDVAQFFDGGGISDPDNDFKIDILATAGGDFTLLYERFFTDELSLEVGGRFALGKGVDPLFISLETDLFRTIRGSGYKLLLDTRYHPRGNGYEGNVYGIAFLEASAILNTHRKL